MRRVETVGRAMRMTVLVVVVLVSALVPAASMRVDAATPPARGTPVAAPGCDVLPAYFAAANALTAANEGLATLKTVNRDVQALSDAQAEAVVASLDGLLAAWDRLTPPPAARAWHDAYRDLFAWYREMAANRAHLDHQRLINGDRTIVPAIGRAVASGQATCGYGAWNAAVATTPVATPAP
ncbi:MAG: hypothetical protein WBA46_08405 [Thermomicrobiales bacterium]